jgi:hypothetical protein
MPGESGRFLYPNPTWEATTHLYDSPPRWINRGSRQLPKPAAAVLCELGQLCRQVQPLDRQHFDAAPVTGTCYSEVPMTMFDRER